MTAKSKCRISSVNRKIGPLRMGIFTTIEEKAEKLRLKRARDKKHWQDLLNQNKV